MYINTMPGKYKYFQNEKLSRLIQIIKKLLSFSHGSEIARFAISQWKLQENYETFTELSLN